jgi:hypothetical protein
MTVRPASLHRHEVGSDVAFLEHPHLHATSVSNLASRDVRRTAVTEKHDRVDLQIPQQAFEKGRPTRWRASV